MGKRFLNYNKHSFNLSINYWAYKQTLLYWSYISYLTFMLCILIQYKYIQMPIPWQVGFIVILPISGFQTMSAGTLMFEMPPKSSGLQLNELSFHSWWIQNEVVKTWFCQLERCSLISRSHMQSCNYSSHSSPSSSLVCSCFFPHFCCIICLSVCSLHLFGLMVVCSFLSMFLHLFICSFIRLFACFFVTSVGLQRFFFVCERISLEKFFNQSFHSLFTFSSRSAIPVSLMSRLIHNFSLGVDTGRDNLL